MSNDPDTPATLVASDFNFSPDKVKKLEAAREAIKRSALRVQADFELSDAEFFAVLFTLATMRVFSPDPPAGPLPKEAPELWARRDLNQRENAATFVKRVYSQWLGGSLARKDIARLDPDLYKALSVWLTRHPDDEIARLLPSQSDQIDEAIERLSMQYPVEFLRKLGYAIDTRLRRQEK